MAVDSMTGITIVTNGWTGRTATEAIFVNSANMTWCFGAAAIGIMAVTADAGGGGGLWAGFGIFTPRRCIPTRILISPR